MFDTDAQPLLGITTRGNQLLQCIDRESVAHKGRLCCSLKRKTTLARKSAEHEMCRTRDTPVRNTRPPRALFSRTVRITSRFIMGSLVRKDTGGKLSPS